MRLVAVMVEMMVTLLVDEWDKLKDGSMVETTEVAMVDDWAA